MTKKATFFGYYANLSKATYEIDEELRGQPVRVLGTSQAISGNVILNQNSMLVEGAKIVLDANSFKTDIALRDENVKNMMLKTNIPGNESITFVFTAIEGLSDEITSEQDIPVKINGNLTISGITKPVVFDGIVNFMNDGGLKVLASTDLAYGDFGLVVPDLPFLSNVADITKLTVDLVAR